MSQAFYEMTTIANTSVMVNIEAVDSVVEHEQFVEITMRNGEKLNLIPQTFFVALNNKEVPYMKFDRKEEASEEEGTKVREVEGELV